MQRPGMATAGAPIAAPAAGKQAWNNAGTGSPRTSWSCCLRS